MTSIWRALAWAGALWVIGWPAQALDITPEAAGVPLGMHHTVVGRISLAPGGTKRMEMVSGGGQMAEMHSGRPLRGQILSWDSNADWYVSPPGEVIRQDGTSITIRGGRGGVGYVMGRRCGTLMEDGQKKAFQLIRTWILIVNEGSGGAAPTLPDIPRAVITGRAVMRGTAEGVADAAVELHGERSGLKRRDDWRTGSDGRFMITAQGMLSVDRYEIMVLKRSNNVRRDDSFMEDLWPIHRYLVDLNRDNCLNLNVGNIQMASVEEQERVSGRMKRPDYLVVAGQGSVGAGIPSGGSGPLSTQQGQPSQGAPPPWVSGADRTRMILIDAGAGTGSGGSGGTVQTAQVSYKGYVEVDFNLKATLSLTFRGAEVTGELYAPYVMQPNVRLSGARMQLKGTLTGGWEEGGQIQGDCTGEILWPGSNPETRKGRFTIRKVGNQIRFQSTKFYYNAYIFEAQGFRYAAPDGDDAATTREPGGPVVNSIVILIDASGSMKGTKIANAKATAKRQIASLGSDTELAVIAFSGNAVKSSFAPMDSAGRARAQAVVEGINADGGTPLAAGIREAGAYMRRHARGQKLTLIVLSDGEETGGGNPPEEVRRLNDMTVTW